MKQFLAEKRSKKDILLDLTDLLNDYQDAKQEFGEFSKECSLLENKLAKLCREGQKNKYLPEYFMESSVVETLGILSTKWRNKDLAYWEMACIQLRKEFDKNETGDS